MSLSELQTKVHVGKDKVNSFDKKLNAQSQKFTRLVEWVNEKKGVKRKSRDD